MAFLLRVNGGNPTERLRITSDGKIGINEGTPIARLHVKNGESNAAGYAHDTVVVEDSDHAFLTFLTGTSGSSGINFGDAGDPQRGVIQYDQNNDYMRFITAAGERARIDSSGRLLIGGTSASYAFSGGDDLIIGNTNSGTRSGITLVSASNTDGGLYFSDGTSSGNAQVQGQVVYDHGEHYMRFYTSSDE